MLKLSSTAVQQANEMTKDSNLLSSVSYGVTNVSSKVADVGSKAWSNINSYLTGGSGGGDLTNSLSSFSIFGGRTGYNSMYLKGSIILFIS